MNSTQSICAMLAIALTSGCASTHNMNGPRGPKIVGSGYSTESGQYAEIGVEFSSVGDFFSIVSPKRWKSPMTTGGTLSWLNPAAWSDDAGRTGRILIGQAVIVGGVAVAATAGGGGSSGDSVSSPVGGPSAPPPPPPPPGGGPGGP